MNTELNFEYIDDLIRTFLRGTISAEEMKYLKNWLNEDNANRKYFRHTYLLMKTTLVSESNLAENKIDGSLQKLRYKISEEERHNLLLLSEKKKFFSTATLKWAAAIFLAICFGAGLHAIYLQNISKQDDNLVLSEINVPLGSKSRIILPDRTEVWLNAGSKLIFNKGFGKKLREVNLVGEGYFKVAKIPQKPFIVHTLNANIKALGTEFNVKAYPDENTTETILVEGSVVVDKVLPSGNTKNSDFAQSIILKPGQKVLIYKEPALEEKNTEKDLVNAPAPKKNQTKITVPRAKEMSPQNANTEVETSWKDHSWVIQGKNVKDLFVELGRRFNVSISLHDNELNKYKFSGIIESETLEEVFDLMRQTIPMLYSIDKGKVDISYNRKLESKYSRAYKN